MNRHCSIGIHMIPTHGIQGSNIQVTARAVLRWSTRLPSIELSTRSVKVFWTAVSDLPSPTAQEKMNARALEDHDWKPQKVLLWERNQQLEPTRPEHQYYVRLSVSPSGRAAGHPVESLDDGKKV